MTRFERARSIFLTLAILAASAMLVGLASPAPVGAATEAGGGASMEGSDAAEAGAAAEGEAGAPAGEGRAKPLRDPFRPFTLELRPKRVTPPRTPLEQYEIGSLNLVAIIWSQTDPKAMVEDAGGTGFTIGVGTPIGPHGGVVKVIQPDRVVVEEEFVDFYGEKKKSEIVMKIEKEGGKTP